MPVLVRGVSRYRHFGTRIEELCGSIETVDSPIVPRPVETEGEGAPPEGAR